MENKQLQKCPVCLHQFLKKNLDKHMHSRSHHEVIEKLKGSQQIHKCFACGVSILGIKQYVRHIMTPGHIINLQQKRWRTVDYTDDDLTAVCAGRDQKRHAMKQKKKKEKKKMKARKTAQFCKKLNCNWQKMEKIQVNNNSQSSNQHQPLNAESNQTVGYMHNSYYEQSNMCYLDDVLSPSLGIIFTDPEEVEDSSQQSRSVHKRRLLDVDPHNSAPVKRPLLSDITSVDLKTDSSSRRSNKCMTHTTSSDKSAQSLHASVLDHMHVNPCLSTSLRSMHQSLKKTPSSTLKKCLQKPFPGFQPAGGVSWHKTKQLEARIEGKSSTLLKLSGGYRLVAAKAVLLQESKTNQLKKQESTPSTHSLPALLNRSATKNEASKPNLNVARDIQVSQKPNCPKTGSASKVSKPALQKLISSKGSQWKVNWEEIYEEATMEKLQREKGLPRFGIEFVSPPTPGPLERVLESINYKDETPSTSVVPSSANTCESQLAEAFPGPSNERHDGDPSMITSQPMETTLMKTKKIKRADVKDAMRNSASLTNRTSWPVTEGTGREDANASNPIRHSKKQDVPKFQIPKQKLSQLLSMFQREEELKIYLDHANSELLLAQSALHVALSNVQNLLEIKQQVTAEMGLLISKNIEVLQRIQNSSLGGMSCTEFPNLGTESHERVPDTSRLQHDQVLDPSLTRPEKRCSHTAP